MKKKKIQNISILTIAILIIGSIIGYNYSVDITKQKGLQFGNELNQIENDISNIQEKFYSEKIKWVEGDISKIELLKFYEIHIDNFKKNSLRRKLFSYLKEKNISCIVATHDGDDALSFADQMMVIKNKKVIALDSPRNLYKNPSEHYVAALFDDVNELYIDGEKKLIYPHQIQVSKDSSHKAIVKKAFFKGSFWLIEATFNSQVIFFQNPENIVLGKEISLSFID